MASNGAVPSVHGSAFLAWKFNVHGRASAAGVFQDSLSLPSSATYSEEALSRVRRGGLRLDFEPSTPIKTWHLVRTDGLNSSPWLPCSLSCLQLLSFPCC